MSKQLPPQTPVARISPWMSTAQTAKHLGYSELQILQFVRAKDHPLPSHQAGGRGGVHRFHVDEVDAWMLSHARITCSSPTPGSDDGQAA